MLAPPLVALGVPDVTGLRLDRLVTREGAPYIDRFHIVYTPDFSARFHHWLASDDQRAPHDHPADNLSLVLAGRMIEHTAQGDRELAPGSLVTRKAEDAHAVELLTEDAWTLFALGKVRRRWGFHTPRGWVNWVAYEHAGQYLTADESARPW